MLKRANKIIALLVAAASVIAVVPAIADDDSSVTTLESKDGTITNAIAYKDGKYVYQGYKGDDDTDGIYYNDGSKDEALDDVSDSDLNVVYGEKYAFANDGSDQYLIDLSSGSVSDDNIPSDDISTVATQLKTKLNKTDRYKGSSDITVDTSNLEAEQTEADNKILAIPGTKFGDTYYSYSVSTTSSNATKYIDNKGNLYGFTDASSKYIDMSYTANIYAYSTKEGKTVKIENYSNSYDDVDSDSGLLATLVKQPVALTQDKDSIYALVTVAITDTASNAKVTNETTASAADYVSDIDGNATTSLRTYIQKVSKEQGDQEDDAYLPKTVETYEIGNVNSEYDCGDATNAYNAIGDAITDTGADITSGSTYDLSLVTQEMVTARVDSVGIARPLFTINDGNLIVVKASTSSVDGVTLKFKKDKVKYTNLPAYKSTDAISSSTKVDGYLVEKDTDSSVDIDDIDDGNQFATYDIDADGNVWVVAEGKIYEYKDTGSMDEVYNCDSSLNSISVYDKDNIIAWESNDDIYTTVTEGKDNTSATTSSTTASTGAIATTTVAQNGWIQLTDGTWNYYNETGSKVVSNWIESNGVWYYLKADGAMATGWQQVGGVWYYMSSSGEMQTGWINVSGSWYYCDSSGGMLYSTTVDGYTLGSNGAMI